MIGKSIGPYQILAELGRGGMGEVYRATDRNLKRSVAIKVLPAAVAGDADRLARFQLEAEVLATLNHPNIAAIYGLEKTADVTALIMELVDGHNLSTLVANGQVALETESVSSRSRESNAQQVSGGLPRGLNIDDAVAIARQIADALECAHESGIIHRDLKPANVMVRDDGTVKILDFGLAKAMDPAGTSSAGSTANSPTLTARATQMGMILGTAAYMAPEQARGKPVDKRADIWAFGVVLYEMVTGRRAFPGDEISDVLAAVLRQDIDWSALPIGTPPRLRRLLERCLDRDAKTRLRDIGEARVELAKISGGALETVDAVVPGSTPRSRYRVPIAWSVAGIALLATGALVDRYVWQTTVSHSAAVRLAFVPPVGLTFEADRLDTIVVSPDGRQLAFSARSTDGKRQLYVRGLDGVEAKLLPGTAEPIKPFWSPDSKSIAFGAQGKLKRVGIGGGQPAVVADAPRLNGGAWNKSGLIIFVSDYNAGIFQVSDKGGATRAVTMPDASRQETGLGDPVFLPDGVHFLYSGGSQAKPEVRLGSLSSPDTKAVVEGAGPRFVAPATLLFERAGTLLAGTFDPERLVLSGDLIPAVADDAQSTNRGDIPYSVSDTGVLVQKNGFAPDYQLVWFDRQGRSLGPVGAAAHAGGEGFAPRISRDGTRVAIQIRSGEADRRGLWVIDLLHNLPTRISSTSGQYPLWSADSRQIAWLQRIEGAIGIYQLAANGLGSPELLLKTGSGAGGTTFPNDWSTDGRFILYHTRGEKTRIDLWALPLFGDRKPHPVLNTEFDEGPAALSSDGRWLAYRSDVSGTYEIYVQSFTADGHAGSERVRVSTNGGSQPRFRPDGQELFYLANDGHLMAVAITGHGATFEHGEPKALFKTRTLPPIVEVRFEYDVTRDGQRFLMGTILDGPNAAPPAPTIVLNWMETLRR